VETFDNPGNSKINIFSKTSPSKCFYRFFAQASLIFNNEGAVC